MHPAGVHGNQLGRIRHPSATGAPQPSRRRGRVPDGHRTRRRTRELRAPRPADGVEDDRLPGLAPPGTNGDARRHERRRGRRIGARRDRRQCPRPAVGSSSTRRCHPERMTVRSDSRTKRYGSSRLSPIPADGNPGSRTGSSRGDRRTSEIVEEPPHERPPSNDANSAIAGWKGFWVLRYTTVTEPSGRTSGITPAPTAWSAVRTGALQFRPPSRDVDARTTSPGPPKCRPSSSHSA